MLGSLVSPTPVSRNYIPVLFGVTRCHIIVYSDCEFVSNYTNYFGIAQFFGFAFAPMAGLLIDGLEKYFERSIGFARRNLFKNFASKSGP